MPAPIPPFLLQLVGGERCGAAVQHHIVEVDIRLGLDCSMDRPCSIRKLVIELLLPPSPSFCCFLVQGPVPACTCLLGSLSKQLADVMPGRSAALCQPMRTSNEGQPLLTSFAQGPAEPICHPAPDCRTELHKALPKLLGGEAS